MEVSDLQDIFGPVLHTGGILFRRDGGDRYRGDGLFHGTADRLFQPDGGGADQVWEENKCAKGRN